MRLGQVEEESIRDNFVITYELMDEMVRRYRAAEARVLSRALLRLRAAPPPVDALCRAARPSVAPQPQLHGALRQAPAHTPPRPRARALAAQMDFGYPQISEAKILREYITTEAHRLESAQVRRGEAAGGAAGAAGRQTRRWPCSMAMAGRNGALRLARGCQAAMSSPRPCARPRGAPSSCGHSPAALACCPTPPPGWAAPPRPLARRRCDLRQRPPMAVTNAVSWRSEGIKHRKNEIFLDVVEKLNLLVSANGTVLRSEILGRWASFLGCGRAPPRWQPPT